MRVALPVDNSGMGMRTGLFGHASLSRASFGRASLSRARSVRASAGHAERPPDRLDDLYGPWQGIVVLPAYLTWHQLREFDVAEQQSRLQLYSIVITQGRRCEAARFLHAQRLREDWPQLRPLLRRRVARAWERKLGLRMPG
jgi:hypothetical protein